MAYPAASRLLRAAVLVVLNGAVAGAAVNFTGRWVLSPTPPSLPLFIVPFVQTGTTLDAGFLGTGTVDEATDTFSVSTTSGGCTISTSATALGGGRVFYGAGGQICFGSLFFGPITGTRCECFDGNNLAGDGCSAACQLEECFTCTGAPSLCVPTPDGGACNDFHDCTSGETCTTGTCGGSVPVAGCTDMSGVWQGSRTVAPPHADASAAGLYSVTQERGVLSILTPDGTYVGSIDSATGSFTTRRVLSNFFCGSDTFAGTVAPDGQTFTGSGVARFEQVLTPDQCDSFAATFSGTRELCGNGTVGTGEACDDGNTAGGDGCSATCTIEPCWTCIGAPSSCAPAVGTSCDDHNPCTGPDACTAASSCSGALLTGTSCDDESTCTAGTCQAGTCQTTGPIACDPCLQCQPGSGCQAAPASPCHASLAPARTVLRVRDGVDPADDLVRWSFAGGDATAFAELGDPLGPTSYALCVFDLTGPTLLFRATVSPGGQCGSKPCWSVRPGRAARYTNRVTNDRGVANLALVPGAAGETKVRFTARGPQVSPALPALPLPLPLTVQVRGSNGACFGATHTLLGVRKNDPVAGFKGRANP